jgi:hypothetical protein
MQADKFEINVKDFDKVDAQLMRKIASIYSSYRKQTGFTKKGWGESSGRKDELLERDVMIFELVEEERRNGAVVDEIAPTVSEFLSGYGESISADTVRKIYYEVRKDLKNT